MDRISFDKILFAYHNLLITNNINRNMHIYRCLKWV